MGKKENQNNRSWGAYGGCNGPATTTTMINNFKKLANANWKQLL